LGGASYEIQRLVPYRTYWKIPAPPAKLDTTPSQSSAPFPAIDLQHFRGCVPYLVPGVDDTKFLPPDIVQPTKYKRGTKYVRMLPVTRYVPVP
jgi:hypothetical protein